MNRKSVALLSEYDYVCSYHIFSIPITILSIWARMPKRYSVILPSQKIINKGIHSPKKGPIWTRIQRHGNLTTLQMWTSRRALQAVSTRVLGGGGGECWVVMSMVLVEEYLYSNPPNMKHHKTNNLMMVSIILVGLEKIPTKSLLTTTALAIHHNLVVFSTMPAYKVFLYMDK